MTLTERAAHEIAHGRKLSEHGAEAIWGWGTPAGQVRARRRAQWIIAAAGLKAGVRALEIGCGTGIFTAQFAGSGARLVALDISQDLLEAAAARGMPGDVSFVCAPFESLPEDEPFDAVIGSSVLHHLEIVPALAHIFRLLRPGGRMAFAEPNMLNPQIMIQKNVPFIKERMGDSPDETAFFRGAMRRMLRAAGFEDIQVIPRDWLHPAVPGAWIDGVCRLERVLESLPGVRALSGSLYISARRPD